MKLKDTFQIQEKQHQKNNNIIKIKYDYKKEDK